MRATAFISESSFEYAELSLRWLRRASSASSPIDVRFVERRLDMGSV
jgi:hypothetical protein